MNLIIKRLPLLTKQGLTRNLCMCELGRTRHMYKILNSIKGLSLFRFVSTKTADWEWISMYLMFFQPSTGLGNEKPAKFGNANFKNQGREQRKWVLHDAKRWKKKCLLAQFLSHELFFRMYLYYTSHWQDNFFFFFKSACIFPQSFLLNVEN